MLPKKSSSAGALKPAHAPPATTDPSLPSDISAHKMDSLEAATDLIQTKEEYLQNDVVPALEVATLKLDETRYHLNDGMRTLLTDPWGKIDLAKLKEQNKQHEDMETKQCAIITSSEQKVDVELKALRRLYLQGAVNFHLHKPTPEQIASDRTGTVMADFKKSTQRLASCKQSLISGSSMKGGDHGNAFRNVTSIPENSIQKIPVKDSNLPKKPDTSLIGKGPNGTTVYSGEWLKYPVAIKYFAEPIDKQRLSLLKNMESYKYLLPLRGIAVPEDEKFPGTIFVTQLCTNFDIKQVFEAGAFHFSFTRKIKWIQSLAQALEWLHKRDPQIIHARLKPSNVLLSSGWKLAVSDYGLGYAPHLGDDEFYCAPEYLSSKQESAPSDVYSFGAMSWYLITEKKDSFKDVPYQEITKKLQSKDITVFPKGLPTALSDLIFSCCQTDPSKRPNFFKMNEDINWASMNSTSLTKNSADASKIWSTAAPNGTAVYEDLANAFMNSAIVKKKLTPEEAKLDPTWRCVKIFFDIPENQSQKLLTEQDWNKFVHFFTPIDETTLLRVHDLFSQKWYYGRLTKAKAGQVIDASVHNKIKKVFLVRESSFSKEGNAASGDNYVRYTVSYWDTKTMKAAEHTRLPKIETSAELITYIQQHYNAKGGWAHPTASFRELEKCFVVGETSLYQVASSETPKKKENDWDTENNQIRYVR